MQRFDSKIAIVGAGVAGLSCAKYLHDHGFKNVTIFESKASPGGRTKSIPFNNSILEMGAQWIHGQVNNIIYEYARDHCLLSDAPSNSLSRFYTWPQVTSEEDKIIVDTVNRFLISLLDKAERLSRRNPEEASSLLGRSLAHFIRAKFEEYDEDMFTIRERTLIEAIFDWFIRLQHEIQGAVSLDDVSALLIGNYVDCDGNTLTDLGPRGFNGIVDSLLQTIPSHWLRCDSRIVKIERLRSKTTKPATAKTTNNKTSPLKATFSPVNILENSKPLVQITLENGETYRFAHLVCTIPLGALKRNAQSLFIPSLPQRHLQAIESLGFGTINKIFLIYNGTPFWKTDDCFQVLLLDARSCYGKPITLERKGGIDPWIPDKQGDLDQTWTRYINRFSAVRNQPNVLCAWIGSYGAIHMENLTDSQVIVGCHLVLCRTLNRNDIAVPTAVIRSAWSSDQDTNGAYTYLSVRCEHTNCRPNDLAQAVNDTYSTGGVEVQYPLIMFAGEATSPHHYSTVHGAFESGQREGSRLFHFYSKGSLSKTSTDSLHTAQESLSVSQVLHSSAPTHPKVIIIGAGIAGLSAAYTLQRAGYTNYEIYEATDEPGGRIKAVYQSGRMLELGAQWIMGDQGNVLHEFAQQHGLLSTDPMKHPFEKITGTLIDVQRGVPINSDIVQKVSSEIDRIKRDIANAAVFGVPKEDNVGEIFRRRFNSFIQTITLSQHEKNIIDALFAWFVKLESIENGCSSLDDLSPKYYQDLVNIPGNPRGTLRSGFSSIITKLLSHIPDGKIHFGVPIERIHWSATNSSLRQKRSRSPLSSSTSSGRLANIANNNTIPFAKRSTSSAAATVAPFVVTNRNEVITACHVIVTMSVGVLRSKASSLFRPDLPERKRRAIDGFIFGVVDKIYLTFEKPFWQESDTGFQFIWTSDNGVNERDRWILGILGFDIIREHKELPTLCGLIGGESARQMENISRFMVGETCVKLLRRALRRDDIPSPISVVRSTWLNHQFIGGSYSSRSFHYKEKGNIHETLAEPLTQPQTIAHNIQLNWPRVLFAGEATDRDYFSTAHGAMRSGQREAMELIRFWKKRSEIINDISSESFSFNSVSSESE